MSTIFVHDGKFHADEITAIVILTRIYEFQECRIDRTRDLTDVKEDDILLDVGGEYDHERGRYDHHQAGFNETHANGIPMAAAGLIWRHYGHRYLETIGVHNIDVYEAVEDQIISRIDAADNGVQDMEPLAISIVVSEYNYHDLLAQNQKQRFFDALWTMESWLENRIRDIEKMLADQQYLQTALEQSGDIDILVLDQYVQDWTKTVTDTDKKLVVYPSGREWRVQTVPVAIDQPFSMRCPAPEEWRGNRGFTTPEGTSVVFIHKGGFIGGASSKEEAIALAHEWLALSK